MEIITISCRCNMTYKYYMNTAMSMLERRINIIIYYLKNEYIKRYEYY